MELDGQRIVLGVTGGVAAYKAAMFARELMRAGARVDVVMTEAATRFVAPATFQALTGRPVYTDAWDARVANAMPHIELSRGAAAIVVAPATADFLAKAAHGLADDLLSTLVVARDAHAVPLLVAPAMNREMWAAAPTRRNVATLLGDGVVFLGPDAGEQACGETGDGRMLEPAELLEETLAALAPKPLAGRRVLLTAGPTFEAIDPVRGITNLSSGKQGFALARACRHAGAQVVLVAGPVALATPRGVRRINVRSAREMLAAVEAALDEARADVFAAVAAVADWAAAAPSERKLKKDADGTPPELAFVPNPDILATVARRADAPLCVGFAAESHDLERHAIDKRARKGVPLLVANLGPETFGRDDNAWLLVDAAGTTPVPRASKDALARRLVEEIAARLARR